MVLSIETEKEEKKREKETFTPTTVVDVTNGLEVMNWTYTICLLFISSNEEGYSYY